MSVTYAYEIVKYGSNFVFGKKICATEIFHSKSVFRYGKYLSYGHTVLSELVK